jgi:hypothetical protein
MSEQLDTETTFDDTLKRRSVLRFLGAAGPTVASTQPIMAKDNGSGDFDPIEESVSGIRARYLTGQSTVRSVVEAYLE